MTQPPLDQCHTEELRASLGSTFTYSAGSFVAGRLKLRTVVAIAPEAPVEDEAMFCREQGAQLVPIRAELYREEAVTINFQQVAQVRRNFAGIVIRSCDLNSLQVDNVSELRVMML